MGERLTKHPVKDADKSWTDSNDGTAITNKPEAKS